VVNASCSLQKTWNAYFQRIAKDNPAAARETVKAIYDGCRVLKDFPAVAVSDGWRDGANWSFLPTLPSTRSKGGPLKSRASITVRRTGLKQFTKAREVAHAPSPLLGHSFFNESWVTCLGWRFQDETRNCGIGSGLRHFCLSAKAHRKDTQPPRQRNGLYVRRTRTLQFAIQLKCKLQRRRQQCELQRFDNNDWFKHACSAGAVHVRGATFTLLLPDGRAAVVNCESKFKERMAGPRGIRGVAAYRLWMKFS